MKLKHILGSMITSAGVASLIKNRSNQTDSENNTNEISDNDCVIPVKLTTKEFDLWFELYKEGNTSYRIFGMQVLKGNVSRFKNLIQYPSKKFSEKGCFLERTRLLFFKNDKEYFFIPLHIFSLKYNLNQALTQQQAELKKDMSKKLIIKAKSEKNYGFEKK